MQKSYHINDDIFSREFKNAISKDIQHINNVYLGSKLENHSDFIEWEMDGKFKQLIDCQDTYVYVHSSHANCSNVKCSQLMELWQIECCNLLEILMSKDKHPVCTTHPYHDTLEPYFQNNRNLYFYLDLQIKSCSHESHRCERYQKLTSYKNMIERKVTLSVEDLLYEPRLPVCDWNENHWTQFKTCKLHETYIPMP